MQKIKLLFNTSRPISWVNTAFPFAAGYLLTGGSFDFKFIIASLFFLIPYNLLMYGINDVFDYESDINNPRKGGVEGAITAKKFHPLIVKVSILSSLPFVIYLVLTGSIVSNLVLIILLFFVIAYSAKYLRFKEIAFLDSITSSIHFVGPLLYALSLFGFPEAAWPFAIAFFLWGCASHAFGAVQDIIPDRAGKLNSIATIIGARLTVFFVLTLYMIASFIVIAQGGLCVIPGIISLAYAINVMPYINTTDEKSGATNKAWRRFLWLNYLVGAVVTITLILEIRSGL